MSKQTNMDNSSRDGAGFGIRVVGTPFYFAPEVINQMLKTKASDIWAVGIMLCEMLTERLPWDGMSKKEMFKLILVFKFETVIKTIDPIIVSLLSVLCEYDYKKRFTCDNIIAKIIELGVIQNIDDIENKRINPPFIPPETLPYSTTIIDFERMRSPSTNNEDEFLNNFNLDDNHPDKIIRTPSNNNEDEFLNNFNLDDNHPDKIISPYKSIQSSHPLMTINRNFE
jgi:serine/threonine protein kinase